jgi:hypothetical protein
MKKKKYVPFLVNFINSGSSLWGMDSSPVKLVSPFLKYDLTELQLQFLVLAAPSLPHIFQEFLVYSIHGLVGCALWHIMKHFGHSGMQVFHSGQPHHPVFFTILPSSSPPMGRKLAIASNTASSRAGAILFESDLGGISKPLKKRTVCKYERLGST